MNFFSNGEDGFLVGLGWGFAGRGGIVKRCLAALLYFQDIHLEIIQRGYDHFNEPAKRAVLGLLQEKLEKHVPDNVEQVRDGIVRFLNYASADSRHFDAVQHGYYGVTHHLVDDNGVATDMICEMQVSTSSIQANNIVDIHTAQSGRSSSLTCA